MTNRSPQNSGFCWFYNPSFCVLEVCVRKIILNSSYINVLVVFVGILGVAGVYEDVQMLRGHEQLEDYKIYLKYYGAALGSLGYALTVFVKYKNRPGA